MLITILTWVSLIAGGILILLMLLSLVSGFDFDFDFDLGDADIETDSSGGLGLLKSVLTFISVSSWVIKIVLATNSHIGIALGIGVITGLFAIFILNWIFKLLLKNEENVNWTMNDSLFKTGTVYLRVPTGEGSGIVQIDINGAMRELKARTKERKPIATGADVRVIDIEGEMVYVESI